MNAGFVEKGEKLLGLFETKLSSKQDWDEVPPCTHLRLCNQCRTGGKA
jgi:hypothetical protein